MKGNHRRPIDYSLKTDNDRKGGHLEPHTMTFCLFYGYFYRSGQAVGDAILVRVRLDHKVSLKLLHRHVERFDFSILRWFVGWVGCASVHTKDHLLQDLTLF